ncbi:MAG: hypothetical protein HXY52_04025 [Nitrospirae bacterium]|nr:hypothetical protein [Nitrospirota bacterium]
MIKLLQDMKKIPRNVVPLNSRVNKKKALESADKVENICMNASCKLRKAGCRGFEGCPGYKGK